MNEAFVVVGFICCEAVFQQVEHWFEGWRHGLRVIHHGAFMAWIFHPSVATGMGEWAIHMIARLAGH